MEKSGEKFDGNYAELFNKSYYGEGKLEREREREQIACRSSLYTGEKAAVLPLQSKSFLQS
jgi:hypothetical protein